MRISDWSSDVCSSDLSASLPLLDLAQRQVGAETKTQGWLPVPVIEFVAREIGVPYMRVFEVVTFYTMFNMVPVGQIGRAHVCTPVTNAHLVCRLLLAHSTNKLKH